MTEYRTPITNTQQQRGLDYVLERLISGSITPTVVRVQEKLERGTASLDFVGRIETRGQVT